MLDYKIFLYIHIIIYIHIYMDTKPVTLPCSLARVGNAAAVKFKYRKEKLHCGILVAYSVHNGVKRTLVSYTGQHLECFLMRILKTESKRS